MQIHELNNYVGEVDSNSFIAIDNGTDTGKLPVTKLTEEVETNLSTLESQLNARIDNIIAGGTAPSAAEVTDARLGVGGVTYPSLGAAIRGQITDVGVKLGQLFDAVPVDSILSYELESGYYSSSDGTKQASSSFLRTKYLYRIDGGYFYYSATGGQVRACLYDADLNFISHIYINSKNPTTITIIPDNAVYCGLFISASSSVTDKIEIVKQDSSNVNVCEYPFDNPGYSFMPNWYIGGDGVLRAAGTLSLVTLYNVKEGDRYYVSNSADNNGICKDGSGNLITADSEIVAPYGKIITVPAGTKLMYFNLYNADTEGTSDHMNNYIAKVTQDKSVLCIGDSVTWLDGRGTYGGAKHINGYQAILRKAGFKVVSAGFSGYPYTEGIHDSGSDKHSIYNEIVNKSYDVSGYDYIVLMGGLNDMLYSAPMGSEPSDYSNREFDSYTFNGAVGGIINYIRINNPGAKLIICTPIKSEALTRVWSVAKTFNTAIEVNSDFWSCYLNNLSRNMNISPTYDQFDSYFYDQTHPNSLGMVRIGELMLKSVEQC